MPRLTSLQTRRTSFSGKIRREAYVFLRKVELSENGTFSISLPPYFYDITEILNRDGEGGLIVIASRFGGGGKASSAVDSVARNGRLKKGPRLLCLGMRETPISRQTVELCLLKF